MGETPPVFDHPLIQRMNDCASEFGVLRSGMLDEIGQRRIIQARLDTLSVEQLDAVFRVPRCCWRFDRRSA